MEKYVTAYILSLILILFSCQSSNTDKIDKTHEERVEVFPVTDFLLGQVHEISKMPVTLLKIVKQDQKEDSQWISRDSIGSLAAPFLFPVIDSTQFFNRYSAHSFLDQTIDAVTFTYDAINISTDSFPLTHVDVYIDPENKNVKRVYLIKEKNIDGKNKMQQLTWNTDDGFMVRTIVQDANDSIPRIVEEKVLWRF